MRISDWSSDVCSSDLRNSLVALHHRREAVGKLPTELLVDLIDAEVDALRLPHEFVDLAERLAPLVELREVDAREVLALIDEHPGFVLKALDLVVALLERTRVGETVLPVIGRIDHDDVVRGGGERRVD